MVSSVGVEQANDVVNQEKWKKDIENEYDHPDEDKEEESGVPVLVNPVVLPNTEANTPLGLDMRVGSDNVTVVKKSISHAQGDGVPVLVNPVVLPNTEANTPLGLDMRVGSDNVSVVKTNQEKLAGDIKDMESVLG